MLAANQLAASQTFSIEETLLAAAPFTNVSMDSAGLGAWADALSEGAPRQQAEKEIAGLGSP
jgi:hypothetical protein